MGFLRKEWDHKNLAEHSMEAHDAYRDEGQKDSKLWLWVLALICGSVSVCFLYYVENYSTFLYNCIILLHKIKKKSTSTTPMESAIYPLCRRDIFDDIKCDISDDAIRCPRATQGDKIPFLVPSGTYRAEGISRVSHISQIPQGIYIAKQKICYPFG